MPNNVAHIEVQLPQPVAVTPLGGPGGKVQLIAESTVSQADAKAKIAALGAAISAAAA